MAKDLAREVGYIYIDSGAMYRAVTLYSIENGIFNGDVIDTEEAERSNPGYPDYFPPKSGDRTSGHLPQRGERRE